MISTVYGLKEYHLRPKAGDRYLYRFETIVDDLSNARNPIQRSYIRNVEIMPLGQQDNLYVYQIFTAKILIKSTTAVADAFLIRKIGYAFDEIEAGVDSTGKIVRIYNTEELNLRWNITQEELQKEYKGDYIENYFLEVSNLFNDETRLIQFLSDYKMFGLYFHGLFGHYLLWEMPIVRKHSLSDFGNQEIQESISPEKKEFVRYQIEGIPTVRPKNQELTVTNYRGELVYNDNNLVEALIESESDLMNIKYSTLLLG